MHTLIPVWLTDMSIGFSLLYCSLKNRWNQRSLCFLSIYLLLSFFLYFFLPFFFPHFWLPCGIWSSQARDQISVAIVKPILNPLCLCARPGVEPASQHSRDTAEPIVPKQEFSQKSLKTSSLELWIRHQHFWALALYTLFLL